MCKQAAWAPTPTQRRSCCAAAACRRRSTPLHLACWVSAGLLKGRMRQPLLQPLLQLPVLQHRTITRTASCAATLVSHIPSAAVLACCCRHNSHELPPSHLCLLLQPGSWWPRRRRGRACTPCTPSCKSRSTARARRCRPTARRRWRPSWRAAGRRSRQTGGVVGERAGVQAQYCALPLLAAAAAHQFTAPSNPTRTHRPQFADIVPELQQQLAVVRSAQPPRPMRANSGACRANGSTSPPCPLQLSPAGSVVPLLHSPSRELPPAACERPASGAPGGRAASPFSSFAAASPAHLGHSSSGVPLLPAASVS